MEHLAACYFHVFIFFQKCKVNCRKKKSIELLNLALTHQTKTHAREKDIFKIARLSDGIIKNSCSLCVRPTSERRTEAAGSAAACLPFISARGCSFGLPATHVCMFRSRNHVPPPVPNSNHRRYYAQSGGTLHVAPKSSNTSVRSPRICLFMSNFSCLVPETDGCCEGSGPQHLIPS